MTLLEALVVVAISAIIAVLAFPRIERSLDVLSLREATGALAANLQIVRSDALKSEHDITFTLGGDGKSYGWSEGETRHVPAAVALRMSKATIVFYGDGSTSGGSMTASSGGRQISIVVDEATGAVSSGQ